MPSIIKKKSPHDNFFRAAMAEKRVALAFFQQHLPGKILEKVDLNSLRPRKDTFVDTQLNPSASDVLFSVNFEGKAGYIYTLVEHQRKPDPLMAFRFLSYMVQILAHDLKETGHKELPIVYPLLFFNGDTAYPYSTDFFDLFGKLRELAKETLFQPFQLIDLSQISDTVLKQEAWTSIMQVFMKHVFSRNLASLIESLLESFQTVEREGGGDYIKEAFTYILKTNKVNDPEDFINTIKGHLSFETEESIMTLAQKFEARGEVRGEARGEARRLEGVKTIALKLIQQNLTFTKVAEITGLSLEEVGALHKANSQIYI